MPELGWVCGCLGSASPWQQSVCADRRGAADTLLTRPPRLLCPLRLLRPPRCLQDMSQLLENVFADPKGFGIGADGRYRFEHPGFTAGTAEVS